MAVLRTPRLGQTLSILLAVVLFTCTAALKCADKQYFSTALQECTNCTNCLSNSFVLRPCELHHDTVCGSTRVLSEIIRHNSHRHKHSGRNRGRHKESHQQVEVEVGNGDPKNNSQVAGVAAASTMDDVVFSNAEKIVWDWQAIALTSAVFACILFFLVMTLYSLHQARQWRRLKENFEADVEELSARLSLMAAVSSPSTPTGEKGDILEHSLMGSDSNYLNNRCVYLEQLLSVRNEEKIGAKAGGNVYIEETNGKT